MLLFRMQNCKYLPITMVRNISNKATEKPKLSFEDTEAIYKSKKTWELGRAYFVTSLCGMNTLMQRNEKMLTIGKRMLGDNLFGKLMKATFYGYFVGGETMEEVKPLVEEMRELGVNSMVDNFGEEDIDRVDGVMANGSHNRRKFVYQGEKVYNRKTEMFMNSIDMIADSMNGEGFSAIRMTALGRPEILHRMSEIEEAKQFYIEIMEKEDFVIYGDRHEAFKVHNIESGEMKLLLTWDDEELLKVFQELQFTNMLARLHKVFSYAKAKKVRVIVDVEQSCYQPAINSMTMKFMEMYNRDQAVVFNGYHCNDKDAFRSIIQDLEWSERNNFYFGAILVRGASVDELRKMAEAMDHEDPINLDYAATNTIFCFVLSKCLEKICNLKKAGQDSKRVQVMVASHSEATVRYTLAMMESQGIESREKTVSFAQLLGMCDHVTFSLAKAGYMVYKYIPYGPVMEMWPFLLRRVIANGSLLSVLALEKKFLKREIWRRMKAGMSWTK